MKKVLVTGSEGFVGMNLCAALRRREEVALNLDYNSHNTDQKDVDGMCELLLKLECVQMALRGEKVEI
jgi:nucleoside-diphosphate-sugar epimerase